MVKGERQRNVVRLGWQKGRKNKVCGYNDIIIRLGTFLNKKQPRGKGYKIYKFKAMDFYIFLKR